MLIGIDTKGIQNYACIIEPDINREASNYLLGHYAELVKKIIASSDGKVKEKSGDLLNDVFISLIDSEDNGEGFDMEYGSYINEKGEIECRLMNVEQFVMGRLKLYAKNSRYHSNVIESVSGYIKERRTYLDTVLDANGNDELNKDGTTKQKKKAETRKIPIYLTSHAASFNDGGDITDSNDDFQKAFAMASIADSTDDIAEALSIREQIDYCIDICSLHDIKIINIFKNIDKIAAMLGDCSRKKKSAEGVFSELSELVEYHEELGQNIIEILKFAEKNRAVFDEIISTY
jgi:hypothetical protein